MPRKPKHCLAKKNTSKITNLLASKSLEKTMQSARQRQKWRWTATEIWLKSELHACGHVVSLTLFFFFFLLVKSRTNMKKLITQNIYKLSSLI